MKIKKFDIEGLILITPKIFYDERGRFLETFSKENYKNIGILDDFLQDNESVSHKNVIRGLHLQKSPFAQGKLIRVVSGSIFDVAVDLRYSSSTFGKWQSVVLSEENKKQFWIPTGFAHGFLALENNTTVNYKCTAKYDPKSEVTILWNDPELNILWDGNPSIISAKDMQGISFSEYKLTNKS